jgi:hypothetical protein
MFHKLDTDPNLQDEPDQVVKAILDDEKYIGYLYQVYKHVSR